MRTENYIKTRGKMIYAIKISNNTNKLVWLRTHSKSVIDLTITFKDSEKLPVNKKRKLN